MKEFWRFGNCQKLQFLQERASGAKKFETEAPKYRPNTLILVWLHLRGWLGPLSDHGSSYQSGPRLYVSEDKP
jgi:hypothetical protein